jgi:hypothetical protein
MAPLNAAPRPDARPYGAPRSEAPRSEAPRYEAPRYDARRLDRPWVEAAHADEQLVVRAAWEAARLAPAAAGWPPDGLRALVFSVALLALKATLTAEAYEALRARFHADRPRFAARLAARGV